MYIIPFAWSNEVGGNSLLQTLARRVARFNWGEAPTVIPPEERRQLGEYYTPAWLAQVMARELVDEPLNQCVLDSACGSGAFVTEAVSHFIAADNETDWEPKEMLNRLREAATGIDVHPVAVHLARAAWIPWPPARPSTLSAPQGGMMRSLFRST